MSFLDMQLQVFNVASERALASVAFFRIAYDKPTMAAKYQKAIDKDRFTTGKRDRKMLFAETPSNQGQQKDENARSNKRPMHYQRSISYQQAPNLTGSPDEPHRKCHAIS